MIPLLFIQGIVLILVTVLAGLDILYVCDTQYCSSEFMSNTGVTTAVISAIGFAICLLGLADVNKIVHRTCTTCKGICHVPSRENIGEVGYTIGVASASALLFVVVFYLQIYGDIHPAGIFALAGLAMVFPFIRFGEWIEATT